MPEDSRQAGAEVEITPEMIEAGVRFISADLEGRTGSYDRSEAELFLAELFETIGISTLLPSK